MDRLVSWAWGVAEKYLGRDSGVDIIASRSMRVLARAYLIERARTKRLRAERDGARLEAEAWRDVAAAGYTPLEPASLPWEASE